ncbi:MAG TPA: protein kinase [Vicinamibacterales bacterium]|nr:protein kinase [Vicinamibacterales bacterium]
MALTAGTRLGPYEILSLLGEGGMGAVYKARDTRLDRSVAIKVLSDQISHDPQFKDRFQREARVISQLEHPNICPLYDVGEEGGSSYLVMQYLEGETLGAALATGAMAVTTAMKIALEIAAALEKAHRAGIVHRDLKPGNIMLTRQGAKLLDFGLAAITSARTASVMSALPTTPPKITQRGTIMGTFQYMAPEQVEGQDADARSDIFAFGAVLFEMLTGRPAFQGKTQASLIGAILRDEPEPVSQIMPLIPPAISRVVKTCLAKDPDDRFQTMHDVSLQLQWAIEGGSQAGVPAPVAARRRVRERGAWITAGVFALVAAGLAARILTAPAPPSPRTMRFEMPVPEGVVAIDAPRVSPDGQYIAFNATDSTGVTRIWLRQMSAVAARPMAGTEGTTRPFWSPDSRFLAFFAEGKLKKIDIAGGPAQKICDAPGGADGTWSPEGVILYDGTANDPIRRVSAAGGTPVEVVKPDPNRNQASVGWPEFLPDGRHYLYLSIGQKREDSMYRVGQLDAADSVEVAASQTQVVFAPPGRLLFVRDGTLVAQPFDPVTLKTSGDAVPLAERIGTDTVGLARFSVSREGTLAYRTGETNGRLVWVDRAGREVETLGDPGLYGDPALSPDGTRLAYNQVDPRSGKSDVWIRDLARGVSSRFTFGDGNNGASVWTPDGSHVVFLSVKADRSEILQKPATGQGEEVVLVKSAGQMLPVSFTRDGRYLAYSDQGKDTNLDLKALPTFGDRAPLPIAVTPFVEALPRFSPDGRFVAYRSNESGRNEIYVRTFPEATGKWQVSVNGGGDPQWRSDGKEIFFRGIDQRLMAADIQLQGTFQAGSPHMLFPANTQAGAGLRNRYDASRDGQRFITVAPQSREAIGPTTVVLNWDAALPQR